MKCTCNQVSENCECHIPLKEKHVGLFSSEFKKILTQYGTVDSDRIKFDIKVESVEYDELDPDEEGGYYACPNCGRMHEDYDGDYYVINGEVYPRFEDEYHGGTMDGTIHDWTEVHCCTKCATVFSFSNGAY